MQGNMEIEKVIIPCDDLDPRFTLSFSRENIPESLRFFNMYGFVVYRNIFSPDECQSTREAMWSIVEEANIGVKRDDIGSWNNIRTAGKYGLSMRGPCFHPILVKNRQNENLIEVLNHVVNHDAETNSVMVSHDRFCIYRATEVPGGDHFVTGPKNLHFDLNPWWWRSSEHAVIQGAETLQYSDEQDFIRENNMVVSCMGRHVQCILNFHDNETEDGGTILVPKFHLHLNSWCDSNAHLFKPVPWYEITANKKDPNSESLLAYAHRIPMREGSVLIWNQTMAHGSSPNHSKNCRYAQFLKAFPRSSSCISENRLLRRSRALKELLQRHAAYDLVTDIGKKVFALDIL